MEQEKEKKFRKRKIFFCGGEGKGGKCLENVNIFISGGYFERLYKRSPRT